MGKEWTEDGNNFYKVKCFNGTLYRITVFPHITNKTVKIGIGASSGKKRKHLESHEPNDFKREGGIAALRWIKEQMYRFPQYFCDNYIIPTGLKWYICVEWADSRRRDIYSHYLQREGFIWSTWDGKKCLEKRISVLEEYSLQYQGEISYTKEGDEFYIYMGDKNDYPVLNYDKWERIEDPGEAMNAGDTLIFEGNELIIDSFVPRISSFGDRKIAILIKNYEIFSNKFGSTD